MDQRIVSPGASKSFRQPPMLRRLAWFGLFFCAPGCVVILAIPFVAPQSMSWPVAVFSFVCFAAGLYQSIAALRRSADTITVDDEGIRSESPSGEVVRIPWPELGAVETEYVMQRLVISDSKGQRRIFAEFHLEDFAVLRRTVLAHAES